MNVYITYDRYEHDEWFCVYNIDTSLTRSLKKFRTEDLPSFLDYGPDDCHSFQLQKLVMTKKEYEQLLEWENDPNISLENYGDESSDYFKFMCGVYDETSGVTSQGEIIRSTDGCSDWIEMIHFYGMISHRDTSDDDIFQEIWDRLEDDTFRTWLLKEYIRCNY